MEAQLKRIQEKLLALQKKQASLQKENKDLKDSLGKLRQESESQQQLISSLRQKVDVLKMSSGNWNDADKKQFEKRISSYIKEIDRCITLLSE